MTTMNTLQDLAKQAADIATAATVLSRRLSLAVLHEQPQTASSLPAVGDQVDILLGRGLGAHWVHDFVSSTVRSIPGGVQPNGFRVEHLGDVFTEAVEGKTWRRVRKAAPTVEPSAQPAEPAKPAVGEPVFWIGCAKEVIVRVHWISEDGFSCSDKIGFWMRDEGKTWRRVRKAVPTADADQARIMELEAGRARLIQDEEETARDLKALSDRNTVLEGQLRATNDKLNLQVAGTEVQTKIVVLEK